MGYRNDLHLFLNLIDAHTPVDTLHSFPGSFHDLKRFVVYFGGFDAMDLLLEGGDLRLHCKEGGFVHLFALKSRAGNCVVGESFG